MSDDGPPFRPPIPPDPDPDPGQDPSLPQQPGTSGERGTASQGTGYASVANPNNNRTKWIEVEMFKTERSTKLQMTEEEHAKLIQRLNIDPRRLYHIDDHQKVVLKLEVDADLDLSTVCLHEAITIRKGLRTKPVRQHAHLEFIKVYKTAALDNDDYSAMLRRLQLLAAV